LEQCRIGQNAVSRGIRHNLALIQYQHPLAQSYT
jgi:hypothetical protein